MTPTRGDNLTIVRYTCNLFSYGDVVDQTSSEIQRFSLRVQEAATQFASLQERILAQAGPATNGRVAVATAVDIIGPTNSTYVLPTNLWLVIFYTFLDYKIGRLCDCIAY